MRSEPKDRRELFTLGGPGTSVTVRTEVGVAGEKFVTQRLTVKTAPTIVSPKGFMGRQDEQGDLIQGTLEMLVLKALARGSMHGYGVAEWIEQTSQQALKVEEGALYPALHRLELRGLLHAEWGASENNRRAKFYRLTAEGRRRLDTETQRWTRLSAAVAFVMQAS